MAFFDRVSHFRKLNDLFTWKIDSETIQKLNKGVKFTLIRDFTKDFKDMAGDKIDE